MKIKIKKLTETAVVPNFAHDDDAGMDIYSDEDIIIEPKKRVLIKTGIAMEFPKEYAALVWDKSGIAINKGLTKIAGVIDAGYRGEYKIAMFNLNEEPVKISKGEKIAQILFQKIEHPEVEITEELSESSRGSGGFGSTGIK
jgi:dUTP pyrophosphatase